MHFCRCEWESEKKRIVKQSMSVLVMMVIVMFEYFAASQTTKISGGCWFSFELIRLSNLNRFFTLFERLNEESIELKRHEISSSVKTILSVEENGRPTGLECN